MSDDGDDLSIGSVLVMLLMFPFVCIIGLFKALFGGGSK